MMINVYDDGMGMARKSGVDEDGCHWLYWEMDAFVGEEPGNCAECGAKIEEGWICMDGGEEYCTDCIMFIDEEYLEHDEFKAAHPELFED